MKRLPYLAIVCLLLCGCPTPTPEPPVPPIPPEPGVRVMVWVEESADRTAEEAAVIRSADLQDYLIANRHKLLVVDKDQEREDLDQFIDLAGDDLPQVFVVSGSGEILFQGAVPESVEAAIELLQEHGG